MKKVFFLFSIFLMSLFLAPHVHAQNRVLPPEPPQETYYKATVVKILQEKINEVNKTKNFTQTAQIKIVKGDEKNKIIQLTHQGVIKNDSSPLLTPGEQVILVKSVTQNSITYAVVDNYRLNSLIFIIIGFFILVVFIAGKKGFGSILGMICSVVIILQFIVPQILKGQDPLLISIIGSLAIMILTMFLAHGINKKTGVALVATAISLLLTGILSFLFVSFAHLSGMGSEDTYLLQLGAASINTKGLLLGGIIIGALGVLDDITTSQTAAVYEISHADKKLEFIDLIMRGYTVGKEHIASLVNTLVLAYAGASLSLFILFILNPLHQPYWVILNSQMIAEEVVRTLAGSIGLVLAVPITTVLAARTAKKQA